MRGQSLKEGVLYKIFFLSPLFLILFLINCQEKEHVVARVNGSHLTLQELKDKLSSFHQGKLTWEGTKSWVERWVDSELLYHEALRRGLDKDVEVKERIEEAIKGIIVAELLEREIKGGDEGEAFRYYRAHPEEFTRQEDEVRVSEIMVSGLKEARDLVRRLRRGEDFTELAARYSLAPTATKGGDMGYFTREGLPPYLAKAAFSTPLGNISGPIKGDDGYYHIILVTDRQPKGTVRDFALIKEGLFNRLSVLRGRESLNALLRRLKRRFKVEVNYSLLASAGLADSSISMGDTLKMGKHREPH